MLRVWWLRISRRRKRDHLALALTRRRKGNYGIASLLVLIVFAVLALVFGLWLIALTLVAGTAVVVVVIAALGTAAATIILVFVTSAITFAGRRDLRRHCPLVGVIFEYDRIVFLREYGFAPTPVDELPGLFADLCPNLFWVIVWTHLLQ